MVAFADAIATSAGTAASPLARLKHLQLHGNLIGDEGTVAFASAVGSGALKSLKSLQWGCGAFHQLESHSRMTAACSSRGIGCSFPSSYTHIVLPSISGILHRSCGWLSVPFAHIDD